MKDETKRPRVSLSGKGECREIRKRRGSRLEAEYDLEGSPNGALFSLTRRLARYRLLQVLD
jgi:hypothetical protein